MENRTTSKLLTRLSVLLISISFLSCSELPKHHGYVIIDYSKSVSEEGRETTARLAESLVKYWPEGGRLSFHSTNEDVLASRSPSVNIQRLRSYDEKTIKIQAQEEDSIAKSIYTTFTDQRKTTMSSCILDKVREVTDLSIKEERTGNGEMIQELIIITDLIEYCHAGTAIGKVLGPVDLTSKKPEISEEQLEVLRDILPLDHFEFITIIQVGYNQQTAINNKLETAEIIQFWEELFIGLGHQDSFHLELNREIPCRIQELQIQKRFRDFSGCNSSGEAIDRD